MTPLNKESELDGESAAAPVLPSFEGAGLSEVGTSRHVAHDDDEDDEFSYAFTGGKREAQFHTQVFKPKAMPAHLVTNVKAQLQGGLMEEDEEEQEEEEEEVEDHESNSKPDGQERDGRNLRQEASGAMLKRTGSWTSFMNTDEQCSGSHVQQASGQSPPEWEMADDLPAGTARCPAAAQAIAQAKALSAKPVVKEDLPSERLMRALLPSPLRLDARTGTDLALLASSPSYTSNPNNIDSGKEQYLDDASLTRRQLDEHGLAVCTASRAATADLGTLIASVVHTNANANDNGGNGGGLTASADEWDLANLQRLKELDGKVGALGDGDLGATQQPGRCVSRTLTEPYPATRTEPYPATMQPTTAAPPAAPPDARPSPISQAAPPTLTPHQPPPFLSHPRVKPAFVTSQANHSGAAGSVSYHEALLHFMGQDMRAHRAAVQETLPSKGRAPGFLARLLCIGPRPLTPLLCDQQLQVLSLARIGFSEEEPLHSRLLCSLYAAFTGKTANQPRFGSHWAEVGFQGRDPATDLRGCGMLGLLQLYYLHQHDAAGAHTMFVASQDPVHEFPLAIVSLNITKWTLQALREGLLTQDANARGSVIEAVQDFYVGTFRTFFAAWRDGGKTMAQSGYVLREVEALAKRQACAMIQASAGSLH
ncbi:MAG: hypothetical protein WDW36_002177 [Sanguina aurantia]